jgi:hypothetical protein
MATHPPLKDRIRAIDPTWDGKFRQVADPFSEGTATGRRPPLARPSVPPPIPNFIGTVMGGAMLDSAEAVRPAIRRDSVLPNLGKPSPLHLKYAEDLRAALPDSLRTAVREPLGATAALYALLLSADESLRARQLGELASRVSPPVAEQARSLYPDAAQAAAHARLPLVNLALPALRQLEIDQFRQFAGALQWLIDSDGQVELFEFVLQKVVRRHLESHFDGVPRTLVQFYTMKPLVPDCVLVLSALANVGSEDPVEVAKAFQAGVPFLYAPEGSSLTLLPTAQCGLDQLGAALDRLALAVPFIKRNLLQASAQVVGADGVIQESEAELLRAIADTLDCPIPPLGVNEPEP